MDDEERAQRDAEADELRRAFNSLRVKNSPDPNRPGLVAYKNDGSELAMSEMTDLQRRAFDAMNALHLPNR
jgi:hypothetical protein